MDALEYSNMQPLARSLVHQLVLAIVFAWAFDPCRAADLPRLEPEAAKLSSEKLAAIDGLIATAISEKKMPGCVVLIGRSAGVVSLKAYGNKRVEPETEAMTDDTVFDLASLTKPLATATSIMKLVEGKKLSLDDTVAKHLPDFAVENKDKITILDLLVHRSGLIPDNAIKDYLEGPVKAKERLLALKPIAPLGTKFMYSDVNFMILGEIVQRVSGEPVNQFARNNIFIPLDMSETMYLPTEELRRRSAPTEKRDGHWMQGEVHDPRAFRLDGVAGHAGLFGSARDLARYATDALAGINDDRSRILKRQTWHIMTTPITIEGADQKGQPIRDFRGAGWDMRSRYSSNRGTRFSEAAFGHGGFTGTALWIDPGTDLYVIFLSNRVHPAGKGAVNPLAGQICEIVVDARID